MDRYSLQELPNYFLRVPVSIEDRINHRPILNDQKLGNFRYANPRMEFHVVMVIQRHRYSDYSKTVASPHPEEQILMIVCMPLLSLGCVVLIFLVGFRPGEVRWKAV